MRRGIAATALVASLALAATACGGDGDSDNESGGPVTITYWDTSNATNEAPTYKALVKEFEAANKDVKVNYVNVPFDQAQNKFDTAAGSKGAPDVLRAEVGWTPAFAKKGFFLPLDGTEAPRRAGRVPAQPDRAGQVRGQDLRRPAGHRHPRLRLQQGTLREGRRRGPKTWDELKKAAATIKDKTGADGYWASTAGYYAQPFLYGEGTDTVDAEGKKITVNSPEAKKAYGTWLSLFEGKACTRPTSPPTPTPTSREAFVSGKVASIIQGPWEITNFYKGSAFKDKNNLGIATVPAGSTGKAGAPTGGHNLSVYAGSGQGPPGGVAEVREVHDLGEVPGDRRPEELHAADPRRRLHRRGQGRPGRSPASRRSCRPPSRARPCRSTAPCGPRSMSSCPRSPATRSPWTRG